MTYRYLTWLNNKFQCVLLIFWINIFFNVWINIILHTKVNTFLRIVNPGIRPSASSRYARSLSRFCLRKAAYAAIKRLNKMFEIAAKAALRKQNRDSDRA